MIEAEIALRLARDVGAAEAAGLTHEAAPALLDAMTVSIEIVDSRWQQGREAAALLKLADLQSHGALVLGEWQPYAPRDWSRQSLVVRIGNAPDRRFQGSHSLGDPAWLLPIWLRHVTRDGATVPKGTVVTTGTWCGLLEAHKGDKVRVEFDGVGSAQVQL
jgi:2-keto-4-pentenoate hydratase